MSTMTVLDAICWAMHGSSIYRLKLSAAASKGLSLEDVSVK